MTSIKPFLQLAQLCLSKGINQAVISPGSRSAALTIAFSSTAGMTCKSISDERSAAFFALGLSISSEKPTVLICTSGTAALNYAPAIAEAYFRKIPLIILTADRPPEWIHQHDGQTIFQNDVFGKHVLKSYTWLPDQSESSLHLASRTANEGLNICLNQAGPVHYNIPIREPFYPSETIFNLGKWRNISSAKANTQLPKSLVEDFFKVLNTSKDKVLYIGQFDKKLAHEPIKEFAEKYGFVTIADCISNFDSKVKSHDIFLASNKEHLKIDFLLTIGKSSISKPLKLFLRKNDTAEHWHIENSEELKDPFLSITKHLQFEPHTFFFDINTKPYQTPLENDNWLITAQKSTEAMDRFWLQSRPFSDLSAVYHLIASIHEPTVLHVGNSMSVRYVNALQKYKDESTMIHCNRGTSGIDGILSTAVGHASHTDLPVYCILGDVSFQYDKNALWNDHLPTNLKIIILNNGGGLIFQMIEGPKRQKSFEEFFKTNQTNKADLLAQEYGLKYYKASSATELIPSLKALKTQKHPSILEVFTDGAVSEKEFKTFINS